MSLIERSLDGMAALTSELGALMRRRVAELCGIVLISLAMMAALALASWSVADPSLSHATDDGARGGVGQLPRCGQTRGHAPQFVLGELVLANGTTKLPTGFRVGHGLFKSGLAEPKRPATGLQTTIRKATHLEIKPTIAPLLFTDETVSRQKKLLVMHRKGVHAAIARGRICLGTQCPPMGLVDDEIMPVKAFFFEDKK